MGMKRAVKYFEVQLKRMLRFLPAVFAVTLVLACAIGLIAKGLVSDKLSEDARQMVEIGVCGDIEDSYLGIGIMALQHMDTSRFAINFHTMEEAEAKEALLDGELTAYLVVPEGFVDSVVSGQNYSVRFFTNTGQMGLGTMLMNELMGIISELVTQSQSGIYGMQHLCNQYEYYDVYWEATDELNIKYIDLILSRQDVFEVEVLGISNSLSMQGYYICGFAILFLLIFGMNGCAVFIRRDMALGRLLASNGVSAWKQVLIEFLTYVLMVLINVLCMFCLLGGICELAELSIPEWGSISFGTVMSFAAALVPVVIMLSALSFWGYEMSENIVSGMLIQFLMAVSLGYVSGCFYPVSFFPEGIQAVGRILPSGVAIRYASLCMRREESVWIVLAILSYTVVFVLITCLIRKRRLEQK